MYTQQEEVNETHTDSLHNYLDLSKDVLEAVKGVYVQYIHKFTHTHARTHAHAHTHTHTHTRMHVHTHTPHTSSLEGVGGELINGKVYISIHMFL